MHELRQTLQSFSDALLGSRGALPSIFEHSGGLDIGKRFDVYRNNVRSSLIDALRQTFPIVERLVGPDYFKTVAVIFIEGHLPRQGTLIGYGEGFPEFLETRPELAPYRYLGDVARLELLWLSAYHAADAHALSGDELSAVAPEDVSDLILHLHPSVQLLSPQLPVYEIWQKNLNEDLSPTSVELGEEHLLVFRPRIDVIVAPIAPDAMAFLVACNAQKTMADAFSESLRRNPAFDLSQTLSSFISQGLFTSIQISKGTHS
tara:strand:- start:82 stop:864 length:783 start_codon:yes stop_codon:yes gene_type:complete